MGEGAGFYGLLIVAVLLIGGAGWYFWCQYKTTQHQRHLHKVVGNLGVEFLRDVVLPDGVEGLAFIDYLLLVPNGVIVLDTHNIEGHLFGGESVDQWSQVVNNRTYKFNNPLYLNETRCQAVSWNINNSLQGLDAAADSQNKILVQGWLAFSNAGNFPKGIPQHVSMIDDLKNNLADLLRNQQSVSDGLRHVWKDLHSLSITTRAENPQR